MFTNENLNNVLENLKNELSKFDSVFFSEAHFQLLFAMEVLKINEDGKPKFKCFPEYPIFVGTDRYEVDLLIQDLKTNEHTIIEFKYKTLNTKAGSKPALCIPTVLGQDFEPKSHRARDLGRYDVLSDLERTRKIIDDKSINAQNGFVVFITNDHNYWDSPKTTATKPYKHGTDFRLSDGRKLKNGDVLDWVRTDPVAGEAIDITNSVGKGRISPIKICNECSIAWENFYRVARCNNDEISLFRILKLEA